MSEMHYRGYWRIEKHTNRSGEDRVNAIRVTPDGNVLGASDYVREEKPGVSMVSIAFHDYPNLEALCDAIDVAMNREDQESQRYISELVKTVPVQKSIEAPTLSRRSLKRAKQTS